MKRKNLISTIIVAILIAVIVPIAIFALNSPKTQLNNVVQFIVKDIEGSFYYGIIGSAPPQQNDYGLEQGMNDIGFVQNNTLKNCTPYFSSGIEDNKYVIKDRSGNTVNEQNPLREINSNILFINDDEAETTYEEITFYFVFLNTASNSEILDDDNNSIDNRAVNITASDTWTNGVPENLDLTWSYIKKTTTTKTINQFDLSGTWTTPTESLTTKVEPKNEDNTYNYIIIKFNLLLEENTTNSINSMFTINLNFQNESGNYTA